MRAVIVRTVLTSFYAIAIAVGSAAFAPARAETLDLEKQVRFEISSQTLEAALLQLARQASFQLIISAPSLPAGQTPRVSGKMPIREAVTLLLQDTELGYDFVGERTLAIVPKGARASQTTPARIAALSDSAAPIRLAQSEEAKDSPSRKSSGELQEIVVTAQKRTERLQDVPISMSVLRGDDIDGSTMMDITEALGRLPGIVINEGFIGGVSQIPVRGVAAAGAFDSGPSPTAYYLDSVPFGFATEAAAPDPDAYDLERVEVLYGPQGTLYGASALNGVVRVLTKDANPDKFEFKARGLTSATEGGGGNYRGDMAVNVPIVEGKFAARAVLGYQDLSGWIDKPNAEDVNDAQRRNMRVKLNAQPTEELSISLSTWFSRADYGSPSMGFDDEHNSSLRDESMSTDYDVYGLKIDYEFPSVSITSATSYIDYATNLHLDIGERPAGLIVIGDLSAKTFAQEVTLKSTQEGAWRWSAGGIYRDGEDIDAAALPEAFVTPGTTRNTSESYAVFGELTRLFLDGRWELTAGLRYFEDDLTMNEDSRFTTDGVLPAQLIQADATFNATTPRLVLAWHPSEQMTVYASYGEGFRSGWHQTADALTVEPFPPVEPDTLKNYELGAKGSLLGGRLAFNTALYFMDWQDVQQVLLLRSTVHSGFIPAGVNGESASGIGFDAAVLVKPVDALELGVNFSWNDLTVDSDILSGDVVLFQKGDRLNESAEYTAGVSMDYFFPLGRNGFEGQFSASANYTSEKVVRGFDATVGVGDSMLTAQTRVSIHTPSRLTVTLFADNLNNEQGATWRHPVQPDWQMRVRPRTIGMQLDYRW